MIPASQRFQDAVKAGYQHVIAKVEVVSSGGEVVQEIDTGVSGGVSVDSNAKVQRQTSLTIIDPTGTLIPATFDDPLYPSSNEINVYRGFKYPDGTEELLQQGVFRLSKPRFMDRKDRIEISVQGFDRAKTIERARFEAPYVVGSGVNYGTAIQNIITDRFPQPLSFEKFMTVTETSPLLIFEAQSDPMKAIHQMATSIGAEFYFDYVGDPVLRAVPDPYTLATVATYERGEYSILEDIDRELDEERGYNVAVVTGETTDNSAAVRAVAEDNNPNSPTYVGRIGRVPIFYVSKFIRTQSQCQSAADALLRRKQGVTENIKFTGLVNASHEASDIVQLRDDKIKVDALQVLDSFDIPLGYADSMTVSTRKRRI